MYSQNLNVFHDKAYPLPIGIANSMWTHGDLETLFKVMTTTYYNRKHEGLFVALNTETFHYRTRVQELLIKHKTAKIHPQQPFVKYLSTLAKYRFSLCVRGNGIDTYQFWESLYLGVIPVVINNKHTNMGAFLNHIKHLGLPFYEIKHFSDFCSRHDEIFFSQTLYDTIMSSHYGYKEKLKLEHYFK